MNEGLWKYSRHPNYLVKWVFGLDYVVWINRIKWLYSSFDLSYAMLIMFLFASIPMMDNRSLENRPDYADYMKKLPL